VGTIGCPIVVTDVMRASITTIVSAPGGRLVRERRRQVASHLSALSACAKGQRRCLMGRSCAWPEQRTGPFRKPVKNFFNSFRNKWRLR
jgi:hypothetical protein